MCNIELIDVNHALLPDRRPEYCEAPPRQFWRDIGMEDCCSGSAREQHGDRHPHCVVELPCKLMHI